MGLIYPFINNVGVYRCPDDQCTDVRSYSMQPQISPYMWGQPVNPEAMNGINGYPPMFVENDLKKLSSSQSLTVADESPPSINDGFFRHLLHRRPLVGCSGIVALQGL